MPSDPWHVPRHMPHLSRTLLFECSSMDIESWESEKE